MARNLLIFTSALVVLLATSYQLVLKEILFVTLGIGRVVQPIEDFPYSCRRIVHPSLEACEDLWLDDEARVLYAACAGTRSRIAWNPAIDKLNVSGRRPEGCELIALNIDSPGEDGLYGLRSIKPKGYVGAVGDESLDFVGFDAERLSSSTIKFYFVNMRPPVDADYKYIDASKTGPNATIEVFELKRGDDKMKHIQTIFSPAIWAPNRAAAIGGGAFVVTNDHSVKVGLRKELDKFIGGGNVAYCSPSGKCHVATSTTFKFPNGLARGKDGLIYLPSSIDGVIRVFGLQDDNMLKQINAIETGMPLDNVAFDAAGDIWIPGFPNRQAIAAFDDPLNIPGPTTVFRIKKTDTGYQVQKALEDGEGKVLSGITTVRHDVKTGRLYLGAAISPFLAICDPK